MCPALAFYRQHYPGSWAAGHLTDRLGTDLAGDARWRPGYAPPGWTSLVDHLRRDGHPDTDLLDPGVALRTRDGRIVDQFRGRLILPLHDADGRVIGFVGRRHPSDLGAGPKYLNTPTTPRCTGKATTSTDPQPPTTSRQRPPPSGRRRCWSRGRSTPSPSRSPAPRATSGTPPSAPPSPHTQAARLAAHGAEPVVATDHNPAGHAAADRAYWLLTAQRTDPRRAQLPGLDPADLYRADPDALRRTLDQATPLGDQLLDRHLARSRRDPDGRGYLLNVIAPRPPATWVAALAAAQHGDHDGDDTLRRDLINAAQAWTSDPELQTQTALRADAQPGRPRVQLDNFDRVIFHSNAPAINP